MALVIALCAPLILVLSGLIAPALGAQKFFGAMPASAPARVHVTADVVTNGGL